MSSGACQTPSALARFFLARSTLEPDCLWALLLKPRPAPVSFPEYLGIFALTCAIEAPVYAMALRSRGARTTALAIAALNLATHPLVFFAIPRAVSSLGGHNSTSLLVAEIFAPAVEALLLWRIRGGSAWSSLAYALAANLLSWSTAYFF